MKKEYFISAIIIIILMTMGKKTSAQTSNAPSLNSAPDDVVKGLKKVFDIFGRQKAETVERLLRWETNHFRSGQWKRGLSAGMEVGAGKTTFPFGWSSLLEFCEKENISPSGFFTYVMSDANKADGDDTFIGFPNAYVFVLFLAFLLNKRNWNAGSWYSMNPDSQASYIAKLQKVRPRIVQTF